MTIDDYVRRKQIELGQSLDRKVPIYLDMNFWITVRDVIADVHKASHKTEFVHLLRDAVAAGVVFCPISESIFVELLKQRNATSRRATAELIDELSLGVTLIPAKVRGATELVHFIRSFDVPEKLHPLRHLVWSKLSYVLGYVHPTNTPFDETTEFRLQRDFFDYMWTVPLVEVVDRIGTARTAAEIEFGDLAQRLNEDSAQHADEIRSFTQAYAAEIRGAIDLYASTAVDFTFNMAEKEMGPLPALSLAQRAASENQWKVFLISAFKKEATKKALPIMHIEASLHAAIRWDKRRKLEGNDIYDFNHATAALPYCSAFFTEGPLAAFVTANHIRLDRQFGCRVIGQLSEAIDFLKTLPRSSGIGQSASV